MPPEAAPRFSGALFVFLAAFVSLVLARWPILDSPPYWDSAMGLFREADFLAETNFDYSRLFFSEKGFRQGGPAVYRTSLVPTLVAILMKLLPVRGVFLVGHLVEIAAASGVGALVYQLLHPRVGRRAALLAAAATLTTPLFLAQTDMLGMDLPLTFLAIVALCFFDQRRPWLSALAGLATFSIKASGMIVLIALAMGAIVRLLVPWAVVRLRRSQWSPGARANPQTMGSRPFAWREVLPYLLAVAIAQSVFELARKLPVQESFEPSFSIGWQTVLELRIWCPDLVLLSLFTGITACIALVLQARLLLRKFVAVDSSAVLSNVDRSFESFTTILVAVAIVLGTLLAMARIYAIPRYLTLAVPMLWVSATAFTHRTLAACHLSGANEGIAARNGPRWSFAIQLAMAATIIFNIVNAHGRYFPSLDGIRQVDRRTGAILERSLEYLADHQSNLHGMAAIADEPPTSVVAGAPFVYFLDRPRLGYVSRPLYGYSTSEYASERFRPIAQIRADRPASAILIHEHNRFSDIARATIPPPNGDPVLYQDEQASPLVIYRRNFLPDAHDPEAPYRATFWLEAERLKQAEIKLKNQDLAGAKALVEEVLGSRPFDLAANLLDARIVASEGSSSLARAKLDRIEVYYPHDARIANARGRIEWHAGNLPHAERNFEAAIVADPGWAEPRANLAQVLALQGSERLERAIALAREAVRLEPREPRFRLILGLLLTRSDHAGARSELQEAVRLDPKLAEAQYQLGLIELNVRNYQAARQALAAAERAHPADARYANALAWLLATAPDEGIRNPAAAISLAERSVELARAQKAADLPVYLDTLACAHAAAGEWSKAEARIREAIDTAFRLGQPVTNFEEHAAQIRRRQPVRLPASRED